VNVRSGKLNQVLTSKEDRSSSYKRVELSVKYSKESTKTLCLLKTRNKVVEVG
jgi:hypothetical protein